MIWLSILNASACTVLLVMMAIERLGASLAAQAEMVGPSMSIAV